MRSHDGIHDIDQILRQLNKRAGANGSIVVTNDGMVVAAAVRKDLRKDIIGALSSFLISATERCLRQGEVGTFGRMVMSATHGNVVIQSLQDYFLVVLVDQFADVERVCEEVSAAGVELRDLTRISL